MNDIKEITFELLPIMDAAIQLASKYIKIQPFQSAVHNLQLSVYWFKEAEKELDKARIVEESLTSVDEEVQRNTKAPTLLGANDFFNYLSSKLIKLSMEVNYYKETHTLPPNVVYNLERGYDKLMETKFNLQIGEMYYGELTRR